MNKKEMILLVVPSIGGGGRERIAVNTAECLMEKYDVKLITFLEKEQRYECRCEVIDIHAFSATNSRIKKIIMQVKRAWMIYALQRKYKAKGILSFGEAANTSAILAKKFGAKNVAVAIHGFAEIKNSGRIKMILNQADRVICISREMRDEVERIYGKRDSLITVENGYKIEEIDREKGEAINGLDGSPKLIAMGRLSEVKGYDRMLEAFAQLREQYQNASLHILGDGELREELTGLVDRMGLREFVHFLGNQSNPYKYIANADIFLLTSHNEGFPNALIESLACRTPVVSVECQSGPREILDKTYSRDKISGIKKARYGILVEDSEDNRTFSKRFSDAISLLLENKELMEVYKNRAYERAGEFSIEKYSEKMLRIFDSFH